MSTSTIKIAKFDAARRQLRTAIALWFHDGDPVSVRTLAYAAYQIIHTISKKRDPSRRDLLFDSTLIKDEYRREWNDGLRAHANFFKHADRDGDAVIDFDPAFSEMFFFWADVNFAASRQATRNQSLCGGGRSTSPSI